MEYRHLGASGFKVPVLSFGTGTFGGKGEFFEAWGATDVAEARRLIDICFDAGVTLFDTADIYSNGASESVLGEALKGKRDKALISTKATFRFDDAPNSVGSSRFHLIRRWIRRSNACKPITSICSSCTASMRKRRSPK
ncbi:aryl-alcohol dehydrogenase-like predicted oxidoreductase [Paraburkholderia terricola]|nr:aryl-alcohol dehydrogenase-like predicted oxidoreductase [Paraburkholderia terricola]